MVANDYQALRNEHNLGTSSIRNEQLNPQMAAGGSQIYYKGHTDKEGRLVLFKLMQHWHPKWNK